MEPGKKRSIKIRGFKRYPYPGWILGALICWCVAAIHHYRECLKTEPSRMAESISLDLQQRIAAWELVRSDSALMNRMFDNRLSTADMKRLIAQPFYLSVRDNGGLIFWNTNRVLADCSVQDKKGDNHADLPGKSFFYTCCDTILSRGHVRVATLVIPVAWIYPFENKYLFSHWAASEHIPSTTEVSKEPGEHYLPVFEAPGKPAFHVHFPSEDIHKIPPDQFTIWLFIAAITASLFWVHLLALHMAKTRSAYGALLFLLAVILPFRILLYYTGLPFHLQETELFSPRLYASSDLLPSLGDLLINNVLLAWIWIFIFTQIPYKTFSGKITRTPLRYLAALFITLFLTGSTFYSVYILRSVVIDSMISFDLSNFYAINGYTFIGLAVIVLAVSVSAIILHVFNTQLSHLTGGNNRVKYLLVLLSGICYIHLFMKIGAGQLGYYYSLLSWQLLFVFLLDRKQLSVSRDLLAPRMIFWSVLVCISATLLIQYFNYEKERETRKLFATKLLHQNDPMTQYLFLDIGKKLSEDERIGSFIRRPTESGRRALDDHLELSYLKGHLSKYQPKIYLYDSAGRGIFNDDTLQLRALEERIMSAVPAGSEHLYFMEKAQDDHYYLARIPVARSPGSYLYIDLALKKENNETVYPELLQPGNISHMQQAAYYTWAIYKNRQLVTQTGDYPFPLVLPADGRPTYQFISKKQASELWHTSETNKSIIVVYRGDLILDLTTIFSYLFGIQLLLILTAVLFRIFFSYLEINSRSSSIVYLTLRRRIHYSMLSIVLISFLILGVATISFFNNRYQASNRQKLQALTQSVEQAILQYLHGHPSIYNNFEAGRHQQAFRYFITSLASQQRTDINIFDTTGMLLISSQNAVYDKGLQAGIMRPDAFHEFRLNNVSLLLQDERIGSLSYLSGYIPLRNDAGTTLGYINVPYFSSGEELNYQISNIVVALINLYAFIFLISSLLAVVITNNLTRSLNMIIARFKNLNLRQNELLDWPYDDEIGLLVKEYNKMVQKVETHALLLAQDERETAWREMARQVAHEIKNPLTPMKLNIQYLQQALKLNHPNIHDLTSRISESLIEQIDNLSYIASDFSDFARMPEARPEELELNETLERASELYLNKRGVTVSFVSWSEPLRVFMDKSQLLRVCTNLLQNAMQAIPEERPGYIELVLGRERNNAILSFRDNGNGIPPDLKDRIFKPYFTTKSSGTGLGLAMTRKIIEFWKGSIWFETEEGRGTTFFLRLPLVDAEGTAN